MTQAEVAVRMGAITPAVARLEAGGGSRGRGHKDEYVRILAVVAILRLDPMKSETLLPVVEAALTSEHPAVQGYAGDFFGIEQPCIVDPDDLTTQ